jgi:hypothetical protein
MEGAINFGNYRNFSKTKKTFIEFVLLHSLNSNWVMMEKNFAYTEEGNFFGESKVIFHSDMIEKYF